MAVLKAKAQKIIDFALPIMQREATLPALYTKFNGDQFKGALGDTVTMRTDSYGPTAVARDYEWRTRLQPIQFDDIGGGGESGIPIKLDQHLYSATQLTDENMTMDEVDLTREVIIPQIKAVTDRMNKRTEAMVAAAHWKRTLSFTASDDPMAVVAEAKNLLDADKVAPLDGRIFVVGSTIAGYWAASDRLTRYDSTGETGTPALRDATIGRLQGVQVVMSYAVSPTFACYQHPSAFVVSNIAPDVPSGVTAGARKAQDGFALRWIADYDPAYLRDRSIVSAYYGASEVLDERDADGNVLPDAQRTKNVRGIGLTFTDNEGGILAQSRKNQGLNADGTRKAA